MNSKHLNIVGWVARLAVAFILGQTLFFKFTGAPETVALFEVVGGGAGLLYATAILELAAVVLILVPKTVLIGAGLGVLAMVGAIGAHVTKLGISIDPEALGRSDLEPLAGPSLFVMAVIALAASVVVAFLQLRSADSSPVGRAVTQAG